MMWIQRKCQRALANFTGQLLGVLFGMRMFMLPEAMKGRVLCTGCSCLKIDWRNESGEKKINGIYFGVR